MKLIKYLFILVVIPICLSPVLAEVQYMWSFEETKLNALPENWEITETNGKGTHAVWEVTEDDSSPQDKHTFAITYNPNKGDMANIAFCKAGSYRNIELSVQIKAGPAGKDSGGGLIWHAIDENHYYLAQWNPTAQTLRLYAYIGGKPSLLESVTVEADPTTWHLLEVIHNEETIDINFDSEPKISSEDKQLDFTGWIGLWAPGAAMPSFDGVNLYSPDESE